MSSHGCWGRAQALGWAGFSSTEKTGLKVKHSPEALSSSLSSTRALLHHKLWYVSCLFAFLFVCGPHSSAVPSVLEHRRLFSEAAPSESWPAAPALRPHAGGFWRSLQSLRCSYGLLVSSGPVVSAAIGLVPSLGVYSWWFCHPAGEPLSLQHEELLGQGLLWHRFLNSSARLSVKSFTEVIAKGNLGTTIS